MGEIEEEKFKVSTGLRHYSGGFDRILSELITRADYTNLAKIKTTWPDLWEKGLKFYEHVEKKE